MASKVNKCQDFKTILVLFVVVVGAQAWQKEEHWGVGWGIGDH